jgi:hypothetical protein
VHEVASELRKGGLAPLEGDDSNSFESLETIRTGLRAIVQERSAARISLDYEREAVQSLMQERDRLARHAYNLENKVKYIETRTSFSKVRRLRQSRMLSGVLTRLRVFSSPIVIEVLPEANALSRGSEVWLRWVRPDPDAPALPWSMVPVRDGWRLTASPGCTDDLALLGDQGEVVLLGGRDPVLSFMKHPWSGRVRLLWNRREKILDLYASEATDITVRLGEAQ